MSHFFSCCNMPLVEVLCWSYPDLVFFTFLFHRSSDWLYCYMQFGLKDLIVTCFFILSCHFDKLLPKKKVVFPPRISSICLCCCLCTCLCTFLIATSTPLSPYDLLNTSTGLFISLFIWFLKVSLLFHLLVTSFNFVSIPLIW